MNRVKKNEKFEKNLEIIKEYDALLYEGLENFDCDAYNIQNVEIEIALDGSKIINIMRNNYKWYFNSRFEPIQVAKQWIDNLGKIEAIATIVIFGLGNGLILKELLQQTGENVVFIIFEPSIDIFMKMMGEIDLSFLEKRAFLLVEGINDSYFEAVFEAFVTYENMSVCKFLGHPNYWACFQLEGMGYLKRLQESIKYLDTICNTKLHLGEGYYKNVLMNVKHLNKVSLLDQIQNVVGIDIPKGLPAIIVSAGPSLSKNIKELKKAKGKSFIIATDSALRGLLDEGIIPDAYATIDPLKPLNRFESQQIENIPLLCLESARYEVLENHKDKMIFSNNLFGYGNLFYKMKKIDYQTHDSGGSVATFAYTVARIMGFQTIILVGQDLAFTDETRYYEKAKEWSDHDTLPQQMYVEVEDIHGKMVKTSKDLAIYIGWFEKQIENYQEVETIDATEGGAKIRGSKIINLEQVIRDNCQVEFDMVKYLRSIPLCLGEKEMDELSQFIHKIPEEYNNLYQDAFMGIDMYTKLVEMLEKKQNNNTGMMGITKDISEVMNRIEDNLVYFHIQHKLEKIEYTVLNNLGVSLEDEYEDALQVAGRGKLILEALKQILEDELLHEVDSVISQIEF